MLSFAAGDDSWLFILCYRKNQNACILLFSFSDFMSLLVSGIFIKAKPAETARLHISAL